MKSQNSRFRMNGRIFCDYQLSSTLFFQKMVAMYSMLSQLLGVKMVAYTHVTQRATSRIQTIVITFHRIEI
jgi:hypothetical protein